jgi:hypothetical protein
LHGTAPFYAVSILAGPAAGRFSNSTETGILEEAVNPESAKDSVRYRRFAQGHIRRVFATTARHALTSAECWASFVPRLRPHLIGTIDRWMMDRGYNNMGL